MTETTWRTWLTSDSRHDVYFLLNKLARPDPSDLFYRHDWIDEAQPLYAGTPLSHLGSAGPWLVRVKWQMLSAMGQHLDNAPFPDDSWGWAYRSTGSWDAQITHWQQYQRVLSEGEDRILRLFDARIAAVLIPACKPADWASLLAPVAGCCIPTPDGNIILNRPADTGRTEPHGLFVPGRHLTEAWCNSAQSRRNIADNFYIRFWDAHPDMAFQLDEPEGRLLRLINDYIDTCREDLTDVTRAGNHLFIRYLTDRDVIHKQTGTPDAT
ncbi:DUF4123 domain-containing protein (plasmid) [Morganella morganii]|uniref:DUF4123 domain-containing protein n=1 Tax=Morganella morganii TaxID=582 RepID=UPI0028D07F12|nr:DUF4123 domain-containing protein [Morganella morganii]WNP32597.1 DUF4123 domain-containing protein [Morganella morganii]